MDRLTRIPAVLLFLGVAACGEDPKVEQLQGEVVAEKQSLDFGPVFIGDRAVVHVRVQNRGRVTGVLAAQVDPPFRLVGGTGELGPSQVATVEIEFKPTVETPVSGNVTFSIPGIPEPTVVALSGEGSQRAVQASPALGFLNVDLGTSKVMELEVTSLAKIPLVVEVGVAGGESFAFVPSAQQLAIPAKGTAKLPITFMPRTDEQHSSDLTLKPCREGQVCDSFTVHLTGSGTKREVRFQPAAHDFADVPVGDTAQKIVRLDNNGSVDVWVSAIELQDGPGSPFHLTLPELPTLLAAHEDLTFTVDFTPGAEEAYAAVVRAEAGGKVLELNLAGAGGQGDLQIAPTSIDFGVTPVGVARSQTVTIQDVGTGDVVSIVGIRIDNNPDAAFFPSFSFGLPVTARAMPQEVDVTFSAPMEGTFDAELVIAPQEGQGADRRVLLHGEAVPGDWCDLDVTPSDVRFGMVAAGTTASHTVTVRNKKAAACSVGNFHVDGADGFHVVGVAAGQQTIASKGSLTFKVEYAPTRTSIVPETALLVFDQTTEGAPQRQISLSGVGTEADLAISPAEVDFGTRSTFSDSLAVVNLRNDGPRPVEIARIELTTGVNEVTLISTSSSKYLAPGMQSTVQLDFRPRAAAVTTSELMIWLTGAAQPFIVPITGTGETKACATCDRPVTSCPGTQSGYLQRGFELLGYAKDPKGQKAVTCAWDVTAAPNGATAIPSFDTDCRKPAQFQADVGGTYTLRMIATDSSLVSSECTVNVESPSYGGLWVETRWSADDELDVHLFLPEAGKLDKTATWRNGPYDCWEKSPRPSWNAAGLADDPVLERGLGMGPELVRVDSPAAGQKYELGLHWPTTAHGHLTLDAQTVIWCGGAPVATVDTHIEGPYQAFDLGTIDIGPGKSCTFTPVKTSITVLP